MTTAVEVRTRRPLAEIAKDIKEACKRIQKGMTESLTAAIEIGHELIEAKERVGHGGWEAWVKKNTPIAAPSAREYMRLARGLSSLKRCHDIVLSQRGALGLLAGAKATTYLTDPEKGAEQEILAAANDGQIPKQTARRLVDKVCDLRGEIKKNGTTPTAAATAIKKALKKAVDHHARTPEQRERVEAMDAFASIVKKGRAFTAALNGVIDSPHLEQLDQRAALFLLSTVWEAQLVLNQIAGKHRRALKNADDAVLQELCEVENVRAELE